MRTGKVSPITLRERIFPHMGRRRQDVLVRAGIGQDCAVLDFGPSVCVATTDPITGAAEHLGRLAVHIACNDLAATGAEPVGLLLILLLAEASAESDLDRIMQEAGAAAADVGLEIVGGHTEVTLDLPRSVVIVTVIGRAPRDGYVSADGGRPGHVVVLTKGAGIEGTAILAADLAERLRWDLDEATLQRARAFIEKISVVPEGRIAARLGAAAMHDVTEGGVVTGVWELAEASGCGVTLDADLVPVAPETQAICGALGADPLGLISSGAMLIATPDPEPLQVGLARSGIPSAVIGRLTDAERLIVRGGRVSPLVPPDRDELWRVLEMYGRGARGCTDS